MKEIKIFLSLLAIMCSQSVLSQNDECGPFETTLSDGTCVALNQTPSASSGAAMVVGAVAIGYGIYKLSSRGDTPEEEKMRILEIADGQGVRLNGVAASIRISTMKPISKPILNISSEQTVTRRKNRINLLNIEYNF